MKTFEKNKEFVVRLLLWLKNAGTTSVSIPSLEAELRINGIQDSAELLKRLTRDGTLLPLKNGKVTLNPYRDKKG